MKYIIGGVLIALGPIAVVLHFINIGLVLTSSLIEDLLGLYEKTGRLM